MPTPQLYDPGEEEFDLRLHVGCGSIYLDGYINIDIAGEHPYENPGLVRANCTTIDSYYGCKDETKSTMDQLPPSPGTVIDLLADMRELPYCGQVDKVVCIQAFEHLTKTDANRALLNWWNALKVGGIVIISVPDPIATADLLRSEDIGIRDFALRHLMGSGANTYALHHWAYTEGELRALLTGHGFGRIERLKNIHFYPAIVLKAKKLDFRCPAREYQPEIEVHPSWRILDIGPGDFPWPLATEYADIKPCEGLEPFHLIKTVEDLPFQDDEFDFIYCSHVLEHCKNPVEGLEELQRVGKRGFVEVPSVLKDFQLQHGKTHPKWACWDRAGTLLFIEKAPEQNKLFTNPTIGAFMHGCIHNKAKLSNIERELRFFFWKHQSLLNIWAFWNKAENLTVDAVQIRLRE